jgi:ankyrin repeat and LEM domain-containing protein 1
VDHLNVYFQYEQQMIKEFKDSAASMKREFREGHMKKSFIYLLIDPQIADNLPLQRQFLDFQQVWQRFINSIFYVGKGTADRPYAHLYDAIKLHAQMPERDVESSAPATPVTPKSSNTKFLEKVDENVELCVKDQIAQLASWSRKKKQVSCNLFGSPKATAIKNSPKVPKKVDSEKLKKILNIWRTGNGVVCLHVFHNLIPVEAYTREAAIIDCLSLQRLTNLKKGDYYGIAKLWNMKMKKKLGLAFLYRALNIYLHEGETQIMPNDLI